MIKLQLDDDDIAAAAKLIGCRMSRIRAVAEVEAPRGAFDTDSSGKIMLFDRNGELSSTGYPRPTILFERHYFHKLTNGRFDSVRIPDIAPPRPGKPPNDYVSSAIPGGYGRFLEQHAKLDFAVKLGTRMGTASTRDAALMSCSWGMFQIMALYHAEAGHPTLQGFITAMYRGADHHLTAFLEVVRYRKLDAALREGNWAHFALRWNGKNYAINKYDIKLAAADKKWAAIYNEQGDC